MYEELMGRIAQGKQVSRHEFPYPSTVDELVEMDVLDYDEDGLLISGEMGESLLDFGEDE